MLRGTTKVVARRAFATTARQADATGHTAQLMRFVTDLQYEDLPNPVVSRTKELFADFFCCALAGRGYTSLVAMEKFASIMGPSSGKCEVIAPSRAGPTTTSPFFAAMLNAAAGHIVEQDDLHNSSVVHPATVVFPAAWAAAQDLGASGREFLLACVVGYEVACRVGEMLGKEHYRIFHTTGTAGTLGAAAAVAKLQQLDLDKSIDALGTAGTQAAGVWEFASDAAMSKQVHTAHAASIGLMSAYTARDGLLGAKDILLGNRGLAKGMAFGREDASKLTKGLGEDWKMTETSFKYWASCRHTHPSADALIALMSKHSLNASDIAKVTARVYRAALDVLGPASAGRTIHESKFSMGFVLAVAAVKRSALLNDFDEEALGNPVIRELQKKVGMRHDEEVENAYPARWVGHVEVETIDGRKLEHRVEAVKGDPDNTLSREEIETKGRSLALFGGSPFVGDRLDQFFRDAWDLENAKDVFLMQ